MMWIGIILLGLPFCLVLVFNDWRRGVLWIAASVLGFSLLVALASQAAGVFTYQNVLSLYCIADLATLIIFVRMHLWTNIRPSRAKLLASLFFVLALVIVWAQFYKIHYDYSGPVAGQNGTRWVASNSYPYPLYSDEWITAGMAQFSITHHTLAAINPLTSQPFPDLVLPFHALAADLFLVLGLSPVGDFAILVILSGLVTAALIYVLCRSLDIGHVGSLVAFLCVPLITNSGNLPGLWFFLTYTAGTWGLLIALAAAVRGAKGLSFFAAFLALILYPQLIVFVTPLLVIVVLLSGKKFWKTAFWATVAVLFAAICSIGLVNVLGFGHSVASIFWENVLYRGSDGGYVYLYPWNVVPLLALAIATLGLYPLIRRRRWAFIAAFAVCAAFWIGYSLVPWTFIIEYFRVVSITALLILVATGAGAEYLLTATSRALAEWPSIKKYLRLSPEFVSLLLIAGFAYSILFYPNQQKWQLSVLKVGSGSATQLLSPAPPVTRYLTADDLALFHNVHNARFVAPSWKGLVVGIATGNVPTESKAAYISTDILPYARFAQANCAKKLSLAAHENLSYAYATPFSCNGFTTLGTSTENLVLYKIN